MVATSSATHHMCALPFAILPRAALDWLAERDHLAWRPGCVDEEFLARGMASPADGAAYFHAKVANVINECSALQHVVILSSLGEVDEVHRPTSDAMAAGEFARARSTLRADASSASSACGDAVKLLSSAAAASQACGARQGFAAATNSPAMLHRPPSR